MQRQVECRPAQTRQYHRVYPTKHNTWKGTGLLSSKHHGLIPTSCRSWLHYLPWSPDQTNNGAANVSTPALTKHDHLQLMLMNGGYIFSAFIYSLLSSGLLSLLQWYVYFWHICTHCVLVSSRARAMVAAHLYTWVTGTTMFTSTILYLLP